MLKKQNGITLVALIITIIVMLILAGVSISLVLGDNGVMTQAGNAKDRTAEADAVQAVQLAMADLMAEYYGDTNTYASVADKRAANYTADKLEKAIKNNGAKSASVPAGASFTPGGPISLTVNGLAVTLTLNSPTGSAAFSAASVTTPATTN